MGQIFQGPPHAVVIAWTHRRSVTPPAPAGTAKNVKPRWRIYGGAGTEVIVWRTGISAATGTHTSSGALVGQASVIAGTAVHTAAAGTHPSSGALVGQASVITGTAVHTSPYVASISVTLTNLNDVAIPNLSGLKWAWWDQVTPDLDAAPTDTGTVGTTDANGLFTVSLPNSTLTTGQTGWITITDSDGNVDQSPIGKVAAGPVQVD